MEIVKEIVTKKYRKDSVLIETVMQYHYDSEEERNAHLEEMHKNGYHNSGQVKDNIGTTLDPHYVWFGSYFKYETLNRE